MDIRDISTKFLVKSSNQQNTIISGYASVFDVVDSQNDMIEKGAFGDVIAGNVKLLWQHDFLKPIGVIKSIYEDNYGLKIEAEINNNIFHGKEASALVKQKALNGLSVGFSVQDFSYNDEGTRLLKKINLMEVSIVTFPANNSANITDVKSSDIGSIDRLEILVQQLVNLKKQEEILCIKTK